MKDVCAHLLIAPVVFVIQTFMVIFSYHENRGNTASHYNFFDIESLSGLQNLSCPKYCWLDDLLLILWSLAWIRTSCVNNKVTTLDSSLDRGCIHQLKIYELNLGKILFPKGFHGFIEFFRIRLVSKTASHRKSAMF